MKTPDKYERLGPMPERLDFESFGTFLMRCRLATKGVTRRTLSQREVGEIVGVSAALVSRWEADDGLPSEDHVAALAPFLGMPVKKLAAMLAADRAAARLAEARAEVERLEKQADAARVGFQRLR
jgi:transcriptional regulator with XRE-family HTH domain